MRDWKADLGLRHARHSQRCREAGESGKFAGPDPNLARGLGVHCRAEVLPEFRGLLQLRPWRLPAARAAAVHAVTPGRNTRGSRYALTFMTIVSVTDPPGWRLPSGQTARVTGFPHGDGRPHGSEGVVL